jgi:hypothetical protein
LQSVVVHALTPDLRETDAERPQVQGQLELLSETASKKSNKELEEWFMW